MSTPESKQPDDLVRRPDGSYISLSEMKPRDQLGHELTLKMFPLALAQRDALAELKALVLKEMRALRDMMRIDHGLDITGKEGGFSVRSACGSMVIRVEISKSVAFGPEIEDAKELIDEFLNSKLDGSSEEIRAIVGDVFKLNKKGRLDTAGILGLKKHPFEDPLWERAMAVIDEALISDASTTYLRFYQVDTERKTEQMVALDLAKV